jgi:hypothetical protein
LGTTTKNGVIFTIYVTCKNTYSGWGPNAKVKAEGGEERPGVRMRT